MTHHRRSRRKQRWKQALLAGFGGALVIGLLAAARHSAWPLLLGSWGSSAVLLLGFPDSGFCKPGRVIGAHGLCTAIGLAALHACGPVWWAEGLGVGLAIALMLGLRLVHPPAGSNPLIVFALQPDWSFLLFPTLLGSVALVLLVHGWRRLQPPS